MKKTLLLSLFFLFNIVVSALAAELNPYAYGLQIKSTDAENFKITLQYTLNAPATSVKIYVKDAEGNSYLLKNCGARTKGLHSEEIDLMAAMDKGVPPGEELSWYVDVACSKRSATEACGRKIDFRSPFSIDIDNNPNSPYFGRIVTTQANNNSTRGIRAYNPDFTQIGENYIGSIVTFPSGNWYDDTHVTPFRIRVLQDGTGRIFVSSADVGQTTYMWQVNPADLTDWSVFLKSADMITLTGHPDEDDSMANHNFDFRKKSNGEWELLLLSSSINEKNKELASGYAHSGIYTLNADLSKKSYTEYITNKQGAPHDVVDDEFIASVVAGNAQFDPNGNILYSSFQLSHDPEESALIHHQVQNEAFAKGYDSFERLKRKNTASGGMRYSGDFTKLAVAAGNQTKEVSICSVSHTQGYMTISSLESVDMISASHNTSAYIVDFAWDYASNLYACVRNSSETDLRGVWVMALNLDGKAISTPAREKYNFSIPCAPDQQCTVTCNATTGGRIVNGYSGGTQYACTQMTVKAEPNDNNYRFEKWTDQTGKTVSTNAEYTFYVYKDMQLTAHFIGAVFNVTWWNLFKNGEDIADVESDQYKDRNERLYRLFQISYNKYAGKDVSRDVKILDLTSKGRGKQFYVAGFMESNPNYTLYLQPNNTNKTDTSFFWLGRYIEWVNGKPIEKRTEMDHISKNMRWQYFPHLFFNRVDTAWNGTPDNCNPLCVGLDYTYKEFWKYENNKYDKTKEFSDYGQPVYWRPWWTEYICDLPRKFYYSQDMPVTWDQTTSCPQGTIASVTPSSWYQWNTADGKLLAWRNGGATTQYPIVHHVDDDMALYATYVDKHIHENDPAVSGQNDATNEDVIKLLANPKYKEAKQKHTLTVTRKLQPGMYNTLCLPFGVDISSLADGHPLKNADVRKLTTVTKELYAESGESVMVLNFEKVTTTDPGKPYLVKLAAGKQATETLTFSGVYCSDYDALQSDSDNEGLFTFHPTYDPIDIPAGAIILVADNRLALTTQSGRMEGLRGYFTINPELMSADDIQEKVQSGRIYLSMNAPTTTSVPLAPDAEKQEAPKAQKIMRNGKIYILRDGKTYSITGARVE